MHGRTLMSRKRSISLVIVDTDAYALARRALDISIERFPVDDVLIFSDDASKWEGYDIRRINKISTYAEYNCIALADIANHLRTDFALVIQYDGFVINPASFSEFFFEFDYIGAPWPAGLVKGKGPMVGNGGFSLRSARLVEATANKYLRFIDFLQPEDVTICRFLRPMLEELEGMCFAPVEVARHFSIEFESDTTVAPFGFHGLVRLPSIYGDDYQFLIDNLPLRCIKKGSAQLRGLMQGFSSLPPEATALLSKRANEANCL
jgi:hypothetical protein